MRTAALLVAALGSQLAPSAPSRGPRGRSSRRGRGDACLQAPGNVAGLGDGFTVGWGEYLRSRYGRAGGRAQRPPKCWG